MMLIDPLGLLHTWSYCHIQALWSKNDLLAECTSSGSAPSMGTHRAAAVMQVSWGQLSKMQNEI